MFFVHLTVELDTRHSYSLLLATATENCIEDLIKIVFFIRDGANMHWSIFKYQFRDIGINIRYISKRKKDLNQNEMKNLPEDISITLPYCGDVF